MTRIVDQRRFEPAVEHGFDRALPAGVDLQRLAEPARMAEPRALQPFLRAPRRVSPSAACCNASSEAKPAARVFELAALRAQRRVQRAFAFEQAFGGGAALFETARQSFDFVRAPVVLRLERCSACREIVEIRGAALGFERRAALVGLQQLAIEVVDARALDLGRLRRPATRRPRARPTAPAIRRVSSRRRAALRRRCSSAARSSASFGSASASSALQSLRSARDRRRCARRVRRVRARSSSRARCSCSREFPVVLDLLLDARDLGADAVAPRPAPC